MKDITVPYVLAKIYKRKGDLSKRWYVGFKAWDCDICRLKEKRIYCPSKYKSAKEREKWGTDLCNQNNKLLVEGHFFKIQKDKPEKILDSLPTIRKLVEKTLSHKKLVLKKKSVSAYKGTLSAFLKWLGEKSDHPLSDLRQVDISDYQDYLLNNGVSTVTVNNRINVIVTIFSHLEKRGHIEKKPVKYNKLPTTEEYRNRAFSVEHKSVLEEIIKKQFPGLYLLTRVMYYQFIRPGEIINLKLQDIDMDINTITVPGRVSKSREMNTLPLHPNLKPLLLDKKGHPGTFYLCGKRLVTSQFKASENAALNMHTKALQIAGLENEGYTLYSWKHSGVTSAYLAGMDIVRLQLLLRHRSVQTTEIYLKSLRMLVCQIELKNW